MSRAIIIFGFVFTTCTQGAGAPVADRCGGRTAEGWHWNGWAIHLSPWRRNRYGDRESGRAFCFGRLERA